MKTLFNQIHNIIFQEISFTLMHQLIDICRWIHHLKAFPSFDQMNQMRKNLSSILPPIVQKENEKKTHKYKQHQSGQSPIIHSFVRSIFYQSNQLDCAVFIFNIRLQIDKENPDGDLRDLWSRKKKRCEKRRRSFDRNHRVKMTWKENSLWITNNVSIFSTRMKELFQWQTLLNI